MCRFLAYMGTPILMDQLLYQPQNSLIHQSYHALERQDPVNGDGFGVGWYARDIDPEPARYLSIRPAWNDANLRSFASKTRSDCIFAHVRDASVGSVIEPNCHPFTYKNLLMMHNGNIGQFKQIKRRLRESLSTKVYDWISGETDSEHFFALFLNHLVNANKDNFRPEEIALLLKMAMKDLKDIYSEYQIQDHFYLNVAITDGNWIVASRYDTNPEIESPTLYYSSKSSRFECIGGVCQLVEAEQGKQGVLIVSEKLTDIEKDWHKVPEEHFVVVNESLEISVFGVTI